VPKSEIKPLDTGQAKKLLVTARDTQPYFYPLYVLAVTTGMRSGEILGLQWRDIDLDAGALQVRRTVFNGTASTPKTSRSNRGIRDQLRSADAVVSLLMPSQKDVPRSGRRVYRSGCG
jgi:integrase